MRRVSSLVLAISLAFSFVPRAAASSFGCESVAGSVVFKDTMYGILTGAVLSGLYVLSQDKDDRNDNEGKLVNGAAIGGVLGLGLGITEIALRECPPVRLGAEDQGFSTSFVALPNTEGQLGAGWRFAWRF